MDILTLLAISSAPGACIVLYIYLKDKHEKEPVGLLVKSFLYGMLSILVTLVLSTPLELFLPTDEQNISQQAVHAFILVALVEEFSKFIFVRGILYNNPHFNEPFDGIVYSVMVGMGFATVEYINTTWVFISVTILSRIVLGVVNIYYYFNLLLISLKG